MFERRVTAIAGGFGSGKTEVALNAALELVRQGRHVTVVDLDLVKPYFRCRALGRVMARDGVQVLTPDGDCAYESLPVVPADLPACLQDHGAKLIVDLGGDPVGALTFGAVSQMIPPADIELLVAVNFARPNTETVPDAVPMVRAIEAAARVPVRGVIANTHLMGETTPDLVVRGLRLAEQAAGVLGVPVALAAVDARLVGALPAGWATCPVLPLRRLVYPPFELPQEKRGVVAENPLVARVPIRTAHRLRRPVSVGQAVHQEA